jgi:hypothetical protein
MTDKIQAAANGVDEDATLLLPHGSYPISDTIYFSRNFSVIGDGAVFDLGTNVPSSTFSPGIPENHNGSTYLDITAREAGTLTTKAALIIGTLGSDRPSNRFYRGITVQRTAAASTAAARLYAGVVLNGAFQCTLEDFEINSFREGLVLTSTSQGCVHNRIIRPYILECRYPITLYAAASGWVNADYFWDGRHLISSTLQGDPSWIEEQWEHFRIMFASTTTHGPNQHVVQNMNFESTAGRKLRVEASGCVFMNNRHETPASGSYDMTIGEASRSSAYYDENIFIGAGAGLQTTYATNRIEYLATAAGINNSNTFITGNRMGMGTDGRTAMWSVGGGSHDTPLFSLQDRQFPYDRTEKCVMYAKVPDSIESTSDAGFVFYAVDGVTVRNFFLMRAGGDYDFKIKAGLTLGTFLDVASVLKVSVDGTIDAEIQNPTASGRIYYRATSTDRTHDFYNSTSAANDVLRILDSGKDVRIVLKPSESGITGSMYGVIVFYEESVAGSPAIANAISLSSSSPYPLQFDRGIYVNRSLGDYDSRFAGDTDLALLYIDAGADRVGIGVTNPDAKLEVNGTAHIGSDVELDGALNHDGSTVGFYGVTPVTRASAYTPTNVTPDRAYDADATTVAELADVVGTLIADLQALGLVN